MVLVVVAIAVVVVIVPVAVGVPAAVIFVPPFVLVGVAPLAGFAEFVAGVLGLFALPAVAAGGLVELMVGFDEAALASAFIVGAQRRRAREKKSACQHCGCEGGGAPK